MEPQAALALFLAISLPVLFAFMAWAGLRSDKPEGLK